MSSKDLQLQLHNFLEHLITCSTNSPKFCFDHFSIQGRFI
jgi:hypothetical protein